MIIKLWRNPDIDAAQQLDSRYINGGRCPTHAPSKTGQRTHMGDKTEIQQLLFIAPPYQTCLRVCT